MTEESPLPRFAIVIPARNVEAYLEETLSSLQAQTVDDFEVAIVDDGSTDATAQIAARHAETDTRFRALAGPRQGVSAARNLGFSATRAPLVVFLDADDLLAPDALERFAQVLEASQDVAALGEVARIAEDGAALPGNSNLALAEGGGHLEKLLRKNFVVNGGALAISRAAVEACGPYDTELSYGEDWEFWCRLAEQGDFALVQGGPVLFYRQRGSGANYRARGSVFATDIPCLKKIAERPALKARFGRNLKRLLRSRQIDIFWSGVRSELQFGSMPKALCIGIAGLFIYPDSMARPGLALRFVKSLGR